MKEALHWWYNVLTESGRSSFPTPKSNQDILDYHSDIAGHINLEYGMIGF